MNRNSSFLDEIASDLTRNQLAGHNTAACVGHKSQVDFLNVFFTTHRHRHGLIQLTIASTNYCPAQSKKIEKTQNIMGIRSNS